ncbi:MAG: hypothetical protein RSD40_00725 [Bacilli bacterium]
MAKDMYQKREERKNKSEEKKTNTTNINWLITINLRTLEKPYK